MTLIATWFTTPVLEDLKVKESFSYCIPSSEDYKEKMSDSDKIEFDAKNIKADLRGKRSIIESALGDRFSKEFSQMETIISDTASGKIKTHEESGKKFKELAEQIKKEIEDKQKDLAQALEASKELRSFSERSVLFLRMMKLERELKAGLDTPEQKMKALKRGMILDLKKPVKWKGETKRQIMVERIEKNGGSYRLIGRDFDTDWVDSKSALVDLIDWDKVNDRASASKV